MTKKNANKTIVLIDYYGEDYFLLDLSNNHYSKIQKTHSIGYSGYIAIEQCGLLKTKTNIMALFNLLGRPHLMINDKILCLCDIESISFPGFIPFIQKFKINMKNGEKIECERWSKNIDKFIMDDFLYFLYYSYLQEFKNIYRFLNKKYDLDQKNVSK